MKRTGGVLALGVALTLVAGLGLTGAAQAEDGPVTTFADDPVATQDVNVIGCEDPARFTRAAADEVLGGRLKLPPFAAINIPRDGNLTWGIDPFRHPSWQTRFRNLSWLWPVVVQVANPALDPASKALYRARLEAILQDWIRDNPRTARNPLRFTWDDRTSAARRVGFLLCANRALGNVSWLNSAISQHARFLEGRWAGAWNHGTMEAIALYRIGCETSDSRARRIGRDRLENSFRSNRLGPVLDGQGATNEQAIGYANFVYVLWNEAMRMMRGCGDAVPASMRSRVSQVPTFLAAATQPDGNLVQIGDTFAADAQIARGTALEYAVTRGASGPRPSKRVFVYSRGYVFGHSGWGSERAFGDETFYSLRFGGARAVHGHHDHMSLTYYAGGVPMIVDAGHTGYKPGSYRNYLRSTAAHNVLEVPGAKHRNVGTRMDSRKVRNTWQSFGLRDLAYGFERTRDVLFAQKPDIAVVYDRTAASAKSRTFRQLWHLAADMNVTRKQRGVAVASSPTGARLWMIPVSLDGSRRGERTSVVEGRTSPMQGWVSERMLEREAAPVVTMTSKGRAARMLTVLVPTSKNSTVKASTKRLSKGARLLTVTVDGTSYRFRVAAGGTLTRV